MTFVLTNKCDFTRFVFAEAAEMARSKHAFEKDCKELIKALTGFKVSPNMRRRLFDFEYLMKCHGHIVLEMFDRHSLK